MLASLFARIAAARSGSVAAEVGLVAPLLLTAMFGVFEHGMVFYSYSAMEVSALHVARRVAVYTELGTDEACSTAVRARLPEWLRPHAVIKVSQSNAARPELNIITIRVSSPAQQATALPIFTAAMPFTLNAVVGMKQELPYVD